MEDLVFNGEDIGKNSFMMTADYALFHCEKKSFLLPFLSACLFGNAVSFFNNLSESDRARLEAQGRKYALIPWFYRFLHDILPEEKRDSFQKAYLEQKSQVLVGKCNLDRFCDVLKKEHLRFALLKGADLAYRLYPDAALRRFQDLDVLFHPDDITKAMNVLNADGWSLSPGYMDDPETLRKLGMHHLSPLFRHGYRLEPHFTLANFSGIDPLDLWDYTVKGADDGQCVLSPELNLLMLARHAAINAYFHARLPKLLTDAAVIIQKENVDFSKLQAMAKRWRMPYPGDLFAAFPEFFPKDIIRCFNADSTKSVRFHMLFEKREFIKKQTNTAISLHRFRASGNFKGKLWEHLKSCNSTKLRVLYHLPKHGELMHVFWAFVCFFFSRTRDALFKSMWHDLKLRDYFYIVESIESNGNTSK